MTNHKYSMKTVLHLTILLLSTIFYASCEKIDFAADEQNDTSGGSSSSAKSLIIKASTADEASMPLPVTLYAFDSNGKCKAQTTIKDGINREDYSFSLVRGKYTIAALHTPASYPSQTSVTDVNALVNMPSDDYAKEAMYLGMSEVNLTSNNQVAEVMMKIQQAKVNISLEDVPADVDDVAVTISSPYTKITLDANLSDAKDVTIPLTKNGDKWTTGEFFIFPTSASTTTFAFKLKQTDGNQAFYSYTYNGNLNAATPYNISGKYAENYDDNEQTLYTKVGIDSWNSEVNKSFTFGPGAGVGNSDEIVVSDFPGDGEIWNGHVVALADMIDEKSCNIMLVSLEEWTDVPSAFSTTNGTLAIQKSEEYKENDIVGWRMPDSYEVQVLRNVYCPENYEYNLAILNSRITECNGTPIMLKDENNKNVRYLADEGKTAFSFVKSSTTATAGATVKYHLRLVRNIILKKK